MRRIKNIDFEKIWRENRYKNPYERWKRMKKDLQLTNGTIEKILGYKYNTLATATTPSNDRFPRHLLFVLTMYEYMKWKGEQDIKNLVFHECFEKPARKK
jgi:hypothetical protein